MHTANSIFAFVFVNTVGLHSIYEILVLHNCVVWFYIHFNYLIVYHVIILYFSVLLPIVSILLCIVYMNCMVFTGMSVAIYALCR